jgi:hypothetical protein
MAPSEPDFDLATAHRFFSARCFNAAWKLMDGWGAQTEPAPERQEELLAASYASLWHWRQRADVTARSLSVAYWQLSRIFALLDRSMPARQCAELSLKSASEPDVPVFYRAYALEALARATALGGELDRAAECLRGARELTEQISDEDDRKRLLDDLSTIGLGAAP